MSTTDAQLISDYLDGNDRAIGTLVDRYLVDVYNFALKLTNDSQAAEDIVQESFIKAWKNIRGFRRGSSFRTWLFTITRNTAIDLLRKRKDLTFSNFETEDGRNILVETIDDKGLLPDELLAQAESVQFVQSLLSELDPLYRDVLTLRYSENLTFNDIGRILKRPLHTVKSQHRRAMIALRRSFEASLV